MARLEAMLVTALILWTIVTAFFTAVTYTTMTKDGEAKGADPTKPGNADAEKLGYRVAKRIGHSTYLWNPFLNQGTLLSFEEREKKGLLGLLPPCEETLELQAARVLLQLKKDCESQLERYELLASLAAYNTRLFYYVILQNLKKIAPIIYTPTVGEACQKFDKIYQSALGMYFDAFRMRGKYRKILDNWPSNNVQIIVVSDGGRILGLGDLGANGMGIPIGKISLYVAGAGFHPEHSLPALLDCGTDNKDLLEDKFYMGNKEKRLTGDEHMAVVEEFVYAVKDKYPHCLIQFEDFNTDRAFAILERLRDKVLCFNDDIQGTAAVVVAGLINGLKAQGTELKDARFLFYGAGSSAVGVADLLARLTRKDGGLSERESFGETFTVTVLHGDADVVHASHIEDNENQYEHIWAMDSKGIVSKDRGDELPGHKLIVARETNDIKTKDLHEVVKAVKPHALIGLTGRGPAFSKETVEEMCKHSKRPLILALSNPTSQAEITAEDAINFSKGAAMFMSGSPFDPVEYDGRTIEIGQANNVYIFPGVGFGAVMSKAKTVTDDMFLAAAQALADYVDKDRIMNGTVYPELENLREISAVIAAAVADECFKSGNAQMEKPEGSLLDYMKSRMWHPEEKLSTKIAAHDV